MCRTKRLNLKKNLLQLKIILFQLQLKNQSKRRRRSLQQPLENQKILKPQKSKLRKKHKRKRSQFPKRSNLQPHQKHKK